ncbi:MAG: hypothetical protein QXU20_01535 [Candidatus Woesearchaeota archaeon]
MQSNIYEKMEISRIEQKINELISFYEKVYENNKEGYFHLTTARELIKLKNNSKNENKNFIEKNIYFLIALEKLKEISGLEQRIIFLEKGKSLEFEKELKSKYKKDYYPVCYLKDNDEKKLVVISYYKTLQEGGPELLVLKDY